MITTHHRHDHVATREIPRQRQRHHVGLGAGIGEAHAVQMKTFRHSFRESNFTYMMRPNADAHGKC